MTVQPPGFEPQATQPPVQDRRAPERRSGQRRREDRARAFSAAFAAGTAAAGGLVVLFLFFWVLGAIDIENAVGVAVAAVVLALVWLAGFIYKRRAVDATTVRHDRERRGF